jgi:hypothetical protein
VSVKLTKPKTGKFEILNKSDGCVCFFAGLKNA